MKIAEVEFALIELRRRVHPAGVRRLMVQMTTDTGLTGWGEARSVWRSDELLARREAILAILAGRSVYEIEELGVLDTLADRSIRCAMETACWDLIGRSMQQPLCHLWGGGYRRRIPLAVRLPFGSPDEIARLSGELADQGIQAQIIVSTGDPETDVQIVAAIREQVSQRVELRLDGRETYSRDVAQQLCLNLEPYRLQFFLDPMAKPSGRDWSTLAAHTTVRLGAGRSIRCPADLFELARLGAVRYVTLDLHNVGGIQSARRCIAVAASADIRPVLSCGSSPGPALAAMLHLAGSEPAAAWCNETAHYRLEGDILLESLEVTGGMLTVPQGPGLGIEIDRAKFEQYRI
ncbi:MAG: enolase C-terminal domain-like protein [Planctomycetia bacterium]|jgi:L-alanine-DL-glutamate epimerase-like enolase superfamily enzyme